MQTGFLDSRVVQVHPTLRCNLACAHCYSSSGPTAHGELEVQALVDRLTKLRAEGYEVVSFSGGEPLTYRGFDEVAAEARRLGFRVNLITNGMLLNERRVARLAPLVSVVGLSLDGIPHRHDQLRGKAGAFEKLEACLPLLRAYDVTFGFAHCVTTESIGDLPWLLELALEQGASLLQLHPLTLAGRAAELCGPLALSTADLSRLFILAEVLRVQANRRLVVQLDIAAVQHVLAQRSKYAVLEAESRDELAEAPLADLVNPLVVDEKGHMWPLAYGMAPDQCLTADGAEDWKAALARYKSGGAARFQELLASAFGRLEEERERFVDWYGYLVEHSFRRQAEGSLVALG